MNLDSQATQTEFAELVGASQQAIGKHVASGVLEKGATYRAWLLAYCERMRTEAAGRTQSEARERRDLAQAVESEVNAQMKMRQLYKEDGLILDLDSVRQVMAEWATIGKNEFTGAVDKIITAIESEHGITVDRDSVQYDVNVALNAIGNYAFEPEEIGAGDSAAMGSPA